MLKKRNLLFLSLLILGVFSITGCFLIPSPNYTITYDGNSHTGGSVPTDSTVYKENDTVMVLDKGDLVKTGYNFAGWNTAAGGSGTDHAVGSTFTMGVADVTLYAQWATNTYTVTFNGSYIGSQTVEQGGLVIEPTAPTRAGYTFGGWYKESGCINSWDFATDTVTSNVTLYAKWTPLYALRDTGPAGGLIFYVKEGGYSGGWMYLEAAPSDQSTGIQWYNGSYVVTGAIGTAIGTGQANTTAIVDTQGTGSYAAQLCNDLEEGGYDDWFLPSKDELNLMYENLGVAGVGGFVDYGYLPYWSSSEYDANYAWYQYFGDGSQDIYYGGFKSLADRVRALRAF